MSDAALLHFDPLGSELLGVWTESGGILSSFYVNGLGSPEHQYAEALVMSSDWQAAVLSLPETSPYVAFWAVTDRESGETTQQVFDRVNSSSQGS